MALLGSVPSFVAWYLPGPLLPLALVLILIWAWFLATGGIYPPPLRPYYWRLLLDLPRCICSAHVERRDGFQAALLSVYWK